MYRSASPSTFWKSNPQPLGAISASILAASPWSRNAGLSCLFREASGKKRQSRTDVLKGAELEDAEVGSITGEKGAGGAETDGGDVNVGEGARIRRSKIDSITGKDNSGDPTSRNGDR